MKIQILDELNTEIDRLFIAGAKFAPGDVRIMKLLPNIQKIGEKTPVIKKLADMTEALLKSEQPEIALADLGIFLGAIMNTQGDICIDGLTKQECIVFFDYIPQTKVPYSIIEPIITTLTTPGSTRFEVIKKAFKSGHLEDFRLYAHIAKGITGRNSEMTEYIAKTIIPSFGKVMIPFLLKDFDIKGDRYDAKRLEVLDILDYEDIVPLAHEAVANGTAAVQAEALKILGKDASCEKLLLAYADDKKSATKGAALIGLVRMGSAQGNEKMINTLLSKTFAPAIAAIPFCKDPVYIEKITAAMVLIFENFEPKNIDSRPLIEINSMLAKHENPEIATSIYECISRTDAFSKHPIFYETFFTQASQVYVPSKLYDTFAPLYENGTSVLYTNNMNDCTLDVRWADLFIKKRDIFRMELLIESEAKEKILKYLRLYINSQDARTDYGKAAQILGQHLDASDLTFVAKALFDAATKVQKKHAISLNSMCHHIFDNKELTLKIFKESGQQILLDRLKEIYKRNTYDYYERKLGKALEKY